MSTMLSSEDGHEYFFLTYDSSKFTLVKFDIGVKILSTQERCSG